ncbi:MAG: ROK family protein [Chloroflexi bacterium]|nr:ROK family protein [Chloroflexota bacterium]
MRAALGGMDGTIHHRQEVSTDRIHGPDALSRQILQLAAETMRDQRGRVTTIAVGSPGPLDANTGVLSHPVNFTDADLPLKQLLEDRFGIPAHIQNDANVAAIGEWKHGGHGETEHLIYLTVSTGVGAGVISHGQLIDGFNTTAGEIGHTIIDPDGPLCPWGHRGCVEIQCSGTSIARIARERLAASERSSLVNYAGGDTGKVTAALVARAAAEGDRLAADVFHRAADLLGLAVVNLIHLFSPQVVVIGGGVTQAGELLFRPIRERVARDAMPLTARGVGIRPASLGDNAGLVGAVALAVLKSVA